MIGAGVSRHPRPGLVDALLLVLWALILHHAVVFEGRAFFDRDVEHFLYERLFAFRAAISAGALPLWNPYPAFGEPLLAVANVQAAYPTTWLALLLPPDVTDTAIVVLHTILAALGVRALGLELGLTRWAALFSGALWSASGPFLSCADQANMLTGAALIPWGWFAFARHGRLGGRNDLLLAAVLVAGCLLGGSPESALAAVAGAAFVLVPPEPGSWRRRSRRALGAAAIASVLGAALACVQWLPTAVLATRSVRAELSSGVQGFWSNHPAALAQTILPISAEDLPLRPELRERLFGGREPLLYSLYMGLGAMALAGAALLGRRPRGRAVLVGMSIVAFWLSLGDHGLLWELVDRIPPLRYVRFPSRFSIPGALPLAILAGGGVDALLGRPGPGVRRWIVEGLVVAACAAGVGWLARPQSSVWAAVLMTPQDLGIPWQASPTLVGLFQGLALSSLLTAPVALAFLVGPSRILVGVASVAALLDVAAATRDVNPTVARSLLEKAPPALDLIPRTRPNRTLVVHYSGIGAGDVPGLPRHLHGASPEERLWNRRYYPADSLGTPGWSIESFPEDVPGLRAVRVSRWINTLRGLAFSPIFPRLVELSGVQYVISLHDLGAPERLRLLSVARSRVAAVRTYSVVRPLPRALAPAGVRVVQGQEAFATLVDEGFDPLREVVLASGRPSPPGAGGSVSIETLGFDRVVLDARMDAPGHVVLLDAYDPGWRARVDGRPAPVLVANLAFRAVPVPAGRHVVELLYRPVEVEIGLGVTLVSALGMLLASLTRWPRSSSPSGAR